MIYNYTKVLSIDALQEMIMLDDDLYPLVVTIDVKINADGTAPANNISIETSDVLSSQDEDTLDSIISAYASDHPLVERKAIEKTIVSRASSFGISLFYKYGASVAYREMSENDQDAAFSNANIQSMMLCALAGNIGSLKRKLEAYTPDAYVTTEEKAEFLKRMDTYLGLR